MPMENKMRIAINASFVRKPDSGTGQVTLNFLKKLSALKADSPELQVVLYLEEDFDLALPANFEKKVLRPNFYRRDDLVRKMIWEKWLLPRAVKKDRCDLLFSFYQSTTVIGGVKHLMLVHDAVWKVFPEYLNNWRKKIYYRLVGRAIKQADRILTISENSKQDIERFFFVEGEKITITSIDCDPIYKKPVSQMHSQEVLKKYGLAPDEQYIFYVGGFDVRKNVGRLIEAYGKLSELLPKSQLPNLVLAGKFNAHLVPLVTDLPREIERVSREYGFAKEKIKSIGFIEQVDLPALYSNAKVFCYPSLYEGFGVPPLEAQNSACPVILLKNSSLRELFATSTFMLAEDDAFSLAEAMKRILTDKNLSEDLVARGKQNAQRFSWEKFTQKVLSEIDSLIVG